MKRVALYTDAGVKNDVATWATIIVPEDGKPVERSGRLRDATNCSSTAELRAIANALHSMIRGELIARGSTVTLYTDSFHAVSRLKGVYRKRPESGMAKAATVVLKLAEVHGIDLRPVHIPGHKPDGFSPHAPFNNRCDKLCRAARETLVGPPPVKRTKASKALAAARRLAAGI